jgi:hypothetical protein
LFPKIFYKLKTIFTIMEKELNQCKDKQILIFEFIDSKFTKIVFDKIERKKFSEENCFWLT